jgi:hypothetical protein
MSVQFGDPFLLGVNLGNLDGTMDDLAVDAHPGAWPLNDERILLEEIRESVQEHGGRTTVFLCVPIGTVWTDDEGDPNDATDAPDRVVNMDWAHTRFERMVRIANAVGGTE